jgi:copper(I)-binding protein
MRLWASVAVYGLLAAVVVGLAGCIVYPSVAQTGSVNIRPENGYVLASAPQGGSAIVYLDVVNHGGAGDTLRGVWSAAAQRAELRGPKGPITDVEVPAATTVSLASDDRHIELFDLKQALRPGDTIIVTLIFEKSGAIGAITVVR